MVGVIGKIRKLNCIFSDFLGLDRKAQGPSYIFQSNPEIKCKNMG